MYRAVSVRRSADSSLVELSSSTPCQQQQLFGAFDARPAADAVVVEASAGAVGSRVVQRCISQQQQQQQQQQRVDVSSLYFQQTTEKQQISVAQASSATLAKPLEDLSAFPCSCYAILLEDNPCIIAGHRTDVSSIWSCTKTIFTLHNDTLNIWTHLVGSVFWPYVLWQFARHGATWPDLLCVAVFCSLVSIGLLISAVYHTYRVYSVRAYINTLIADLVGVLLQLACCVAMIIYFEFSCWPRLRAGYLVVVGMLTLTASLLTPYLVYKRRHTLRTSSFAALGCIGLCAWAHHFVLNGALFNLHNVFTLGSLCQAYGWIIGGLIVRRIKAPECLWPGRFNIFFSSHQLFHVMVMLPSWIIYSAFVTLRTAGISHDYCFVQ